jgi:hypothetical protein
VIQVYSLSRIPRIGYLSVSSLDTHTGRKEKIEWQININARSVVPPLVAQQHWRSITAACIHALHVKPAERLSIQKMNCKFITVSNTLNRKALPEASSDELNPLTA